VKWTELKSSHAASFVMPAAANQRQALLIPLDVAHHSGMISPTVPI
jgi:hypothetical protein